MLSIILGVFTIGLGGKAFTPTGLPLSKTKNMTGTSAKIIGVVCILLGVLLLFDGVLGTMRIVSLFPGSRR